MRKFYKPLVKVYLSVINSLAFLPSLISVSFFLLALFMLFAENQPFAADIQKPLRVFLVSGAENARFVLNVLGTGIISLMVFSFSMVMIILSMATNNLSPRVIPALLTQKSYQVVLGVYIGTIVYVLLMILNIYEGEGANAVPELSILIGMVLGIVCIAMFVYFIHSVSKSIQVDFILQNVYFRSARNLEREQREGNYLPENHTGPNTAGWPVLPSPESGYLAIIDARKLLRLCCRHNLQIELLIRAGEFVYKNQPVLRVSRPIAGNREQLEEALFSYLIFSFNELDLQNYQYGMHQLSEIAVKALSPGINDPGTATKAIDLLSLLYLQKMKVQPHHLLADETGKIRLIRKLYTLDELLYRYLGPIRTYGKADARVMERLLACLIELLRQDTEMKHRQMLRDHLSIMQKAAEEHLSSPADKAYLAQMAARFKQEGIE